MLVVDELKAQCRVFCLILKLECDACVTKALRADLLRNWIIRAPASVLLWSPGDQMSLRRSPSSSEWSVTCDQWEAKLGAPSANQRRRDTRDSICQSRDIVTMVTSGQHPGAARVTTALWVCHAPRHGDTLRWHLGHCQECDPCCVLLVSDAGQKREECTVTETIRLAWTSICLNSLRQTDGGIEPPVLGIFAVQCNPPPVRALLCLFIICKEHWAETWILKSLSVLTIHMVVKICTDN